MKTSISVPPQALCVEFGKRLKQLRLAQNLRQQELADKTVGSLSSVRRLEPQGQGTLEFLVRVSQALHIVLDRAQSIAPVLRVIVQTYFASTPYRSQKPVISRQKLRSE